MYFGTSEFDEGETQEQCPICGNYLFWITTRKYVGDAGVDIRGLCCIKKGCQNKTRWTKINEQISEE